MSAALLDKVSSLRQSLLSLRIKAITQQQQQADLSTSSLNREIFEILEELSIHEELEEYLLPEIPQLDLKSRVILNSMEFNEGVSLTEINIDSNEQHSKNKRQIPIDLDIGKELREELKIWFDRSVGLIAKLRKRVSQSNGSSVGMSQRTSQIASQKTSQISSQFSSQFSNQPNSQILKQKPFQDSTQSLNQRLNYNHRHSQNSSNSDKYHQTFNQANNVEQYLNKKSPVSGKLSNSSNFSSPISEKSTHDIEAHHFNNHYITMPTIQPENNLSPKDKMNVKENNFVNISPESLHSKNLSKVNQKIKDIPDTINKNNNATIYKSEYRNDLIRKIQEVNINENHTSSSQKINDYNEQYEYHTPLASNEDLNQNLQSNELNSYKSHSNIQSHSIQDNEIINNHLLINLRSNIKSNIKMIYSLRFERDALRETIFRNKLEKSQYEQYLFDQYQEYKIESTKMQEDLLKINKERNILLKQIIRYGIELDDDLKYITDQINIKKNKQSNQQAIQLASNNIIQQNNQLTNQFINNTNSQAKQLTNYPTQNQSTTSSQLSQFNTKISNQQPISIQSKNTNYESIQFSNINQETKYTQNTHILEKANKDTLKNNFNIKLEHNKSNGTLSLEKSNLESQLSRKTDSFKSQSYASDSMTSLSQSYHSMDNIFTIDESSPFKNNDTQMGDSKEISENKSEKNKFDQKYESIKSKKNTIDNDQIINKNKNNSNIQSPINVEVNYNDPKLIFNSEKSRSNSINPSQLSSNRLQNSLEDTNPSEMTSEERLEYFKKLEFEKLKQKMIENGIDESILQPPENKVKINIDSQRKKDESWNERMELSSLVQSRIIDLDNQWKEQKRQSDENSRIKIDFKPNTMTQNSNYSKNFNPKLIDDSQDYSYSQEDERSPYFNRDNLSDSLEKDRDNYLPSPVQPTKIHNIHRVYDDSFDMDSTPIRKSETRIRPKSSHEKRPQSTKQNLVNTKESLKLKTDSVSQSRRSLSARGFVSTRSSISNHSENTSDTPTRRKVTPEEGRLLAQKRAAKLQREKKKQEEMKKLEEIAKKEKILEVQDRARKKAEQAARIADEKRAMLDIIDDISENDSEHEIEAEITQEKINIIQEAQKKAKQRAKIAKKKLEVVKKGDEIERERKEKEKWEKRDAQLREWAEERKKREEMKKKWKLEQEKKQDKKEKNFNSPSQLQDNHNTQVISIDLESPNENKLKEEKSKNNSIETSQVLKDNFVITKKNSSSSLKKDIENQTPDTNGKSQIRRDRFSSDEFKPRDEPEPTAIPTPHQAQPKPQRNIRSQNQIRSKSPFEASIKSNLIEQKQASSQVIPVFYKPTTSATSSSTAINSTKAIQKTQNTKKLVEVVETNEIDHQPIKTQVTSTISNIQPIQSRRPPLHAVSSLPSYSNKQTSQSASQNLIKKTQNNRNLIEEPKANSMREIIESKKNITPPSKRSGKLLSSSILSNNSHENYSIEFSPFPEQINEKRTKNETPSRIRHMFQNSNSNLLSSLHSPLDDPNVTFYENSDDSDEFRNSDILDLDEDDDLLT